MAKTKNPKPPSMGNGCLKVILVLANLVVAGLLIYFFLIEKQFVWERYRVIDQDGKPVEGAVVSFKYPKRTFDNTYVPLTVIYADVKGGEVTTNAKGIAVYRGFAGCGKGRLEIQVEKHAYHMSAWRYDVYGSDKGLREPYPIVLNEMGDPRARLPERELRLTLPEYDKEFGFDLRMGALTMPYGTGQETHLLISANYKNDWVELKFPDEGTGILTSRYPDRELYPSSSGFTAPRDSAKYQPTLSQAMSVKGLSKEGKSLHPNFFYFLIHPQQFGPCYGAVWEIDHVYKSKEHPSVTLRYAWRPDGDPKLKAFGVPLGSGSGR